MNENKNIRFIKSKDIDKAQWDENLSGCFNKLIYAESVYLDHMCPGWCALVQKDGRAMMPFPVKKKMGVRYAFQPPFIQQLGVFYPDKRLIDADQFVEEATAYAPLIDMNFNYANEPSAGKRHCNYILDLSLSFDDLKKKFRKDLITKAETNHLIYDEGKIHDAIEAYTREIMPKAKGLSEASVRNFRSLCHHYDPGGRVICRRAISPQNETLGYVLFLKDEKRICYMLSTTRTKGRNADANAFLLHEVIREFSGKPLLFDFEGSEIPGVKFFFEKFSPLEQPYFRVRVNKLNAFQKGIQSIRDFLKK